HDRLIRHRSEIQRLVGLDTLSDWLSRNPFRPSAHLHALIRDKADTATALRQIADAIRREPQPLFRARALQAAGPILARRGAGVQAARLLGYPGAAAVRQAVFDAVAESVYTSIESRKEPCLAAILHDQVVWVTTPVRLDFAGGWSDTPPICTEQGGAVLNAAITLNGQYPVQVMAKLNKAGLIRLSSIDLGCHAEIRDTADLLDHADPRSWTSLPKAALVLAGIGPGDRRQSLRRWLDALGGGLDLTIFSAVPKGSGLGTSSILGAALLGCLLKITGRPPAPEQLIRLTSALEQRMNTGGGWQDQVGGVVPGVKLIRTAPGPDQVPAMQWTVFDMAPGSPFRERLLLYYTGYQRMARNILHNVVGRYLAREPETLAIIGELKGLAERMKADLDARDADAFGRGVERYWTLKKRLDAGSTNPAIERILARVDRWTLGRTLTGAGGGGFVVFVARDEAAARHIRHSLESSPPNAPARFFDFTVDPQGLSIRVL
ncbi:MAG: hypothetical protein HY343_12680, partial [Lentisphaerae bacterium]|nr:hypothetical protein [Lentisphaerota bacterium]